MGTAPSQGGVVRLADAVVGIDPARWDALTAGHPFISHGFLSAMEVSASVGPGTGWAPCPIVVDAAEGGLAGALPAYLKSHNMGEYVFDHGWAEAFDNAGGQYYPKLLIAAPFTPATGPRILARDSETALLLLRGAEAVVARHGLSSAHANFIADDQLHFFRDAGWLLRQGVQFHWYNADFASFDDFLATLSSRKRKAIRKERAAAQAAVSIKALRGTAITEEHWDIFWQFYQDTGARKWGRPYLTRAAFTEIGRRMGDDVLLFLAYDRRDGAAVAGALNIIGPDALYGRYWGCLRTIDALHFELCYYQAIDFAIAHGLGRVEAGAQGEHKLARGYRPIATWSAHYLPDPGFRAAVADFVAREARMMEQERGWLAEALPFKKTD
jgi:uncharacterized protein